MSEDVKHYEGPDVDVTWDKRLCLHVGECTRADNNLCDISRQPWVKPDEADPDDIARTCERCPSGALAYKRKDGEQDESPIATNVVAVSSRGPLYITGQLDIDGAYDDAPGLKFRAALCRCGASKNKPFCDNTHEDIDFNERGAVGDSPSDDSIPSGKLKIGFAEDGPILTRGPMVIRSSNGREAWKGTKAALCRCGASNNKPFCDGSHGEVGFEG
jgi:CDGSH-type Zn-finger protein